MDQPKTEQPSQQAASNNTGPRRILVVDDNRAMTLMYSTLLKLKGHVVYTAGDGAEALESAEKFQPDVILLDLGLPKMNGLEVCRAIRAQPWGKEIVMIAVSGYGRDDDLRDSRDAGFDQHLVKPVDNETLLAKMAEPRSP
jgi:CheY-like chemotaxis protein